MDDDTPDQPDQGNVVPAGDLEDAWVERLRTRLKRRTRKLHVATEALKMARLAALYEIADMLEADHPAAAVLIRDHIVTTGALPCGFALAFEQVADLAAVEDESSDADAP